MVSIAIVPGAENGVGPELLLKCLSELSCADCDFIWCGDKNSLILAKDSASLNLNFISNTKVRLPNGLTLDFLDPYVGSFGERSAHFLKKAVLFAKESKIHAMVTGPIYKSSLTFLGSTFSGQTEYLSEHIGAGLGKPFMTFIGGPFILTLVSTHVPLKNVSSVINQIDLVDHFRSVAYHVGLILNKPSNAVSIAVLGLNPHAGEEGSLGDEELISIHPAIAQAKNDGLIITGPWPADGYFAYFHRIENSMIPDVVVAMYHDQGLIPYKLLAQGCAVNATLGLSVPRVSPSHGTAAHLMGTNKACDQSTKMALFWAMKLAKMRLRKLLE